MSPILTNLWWRRITPNDFFNIDKPFVPGPKGQEHIDVPNVSAFLAFAGVNPNQPISAWQPISIEAKVLRNPRIKSTITFQPRPKNSRYHIKRQNINSTSSERHPAWTTKYGWPSSQLQITSSLLAKQMTSPGLIVFLAHDTRGLTYAGFINNVNVLVNLPPELIPFIGSKSAGYIPTLSRNTSQTLINISKNSVASQPLAIAPVVIPPKSRKPKKSAASSRVLTKIKTTPVIGKIAGVEVGKTWNSKEELGASQVHLVSTHEVSFTPDGAAVSILISNKTETLEDQPDSFIYIFPYKEGELVSQTDSPETSSNVEILALLHSRQNEVPIRIIRKRATGKSKNLYEDFIYEGLFLIDAHEFDESTSELQEIRFQLTRIKELFEVEDAKIGEPKTPRGNPKPERREYLSSGIKRDPQVSEWVKKTHANTCQICSTKLKLPYGTYAEGAHIRALGKLHAGEDVTENMLCLCPNCHKLFDYGACYIDKDGVTVIFVTDSTTKVLALREDHKLDGDAIEYHRIHIANVKDGE